LKAIRSERIGGRQQSVSARLPHVGACPVVTIDLDIIDKECYANSQLSAINL